MSLNRHQGLLSQNFLKHRELKLLLRPPLKYRSVTEDLEHYVKTTVDGHQLCLKYPIPVPGSVLKGVKSVVTVRDPKSPVAVNTG